jgi:hypothetical protein
MREYILRNISRQMQAMQLANSELFVLQSRPHMPELYAQYRLLSQLTQLQDLQPVHPRLQQLHLHHRYDNPGS